MTEKKSKRNPDDHPLKGDKRVSLAPLDFEQALKGLLQAGPHAEDDEPEPAEDTEKAPRKGRLRSKSDRQ